MTKTLQQIGDELREFLTTEEWTTLSQAARERQTIKRLQDEWDRRWGIEVHRIKNRARQRKWKAHDDEISDRANENARSAAGSGKP